MRGQNITKQLSEIVRSEHKVAEAVDNELEPEQEQFLAQSGFSVVESEYSSNVELHKTLPSGEEVRVFFDIDEVSDIELAAPEFGAEEGIEDKEQFDEELDQYESTFANVKVFISKPESNTGLFFNLMLQNSEEELFVDYFNYKLTPPSSWPRLRNRALSWLLLSTRVLNSPTWMNPCKSPWRTTWRRRESTRNWLTSSSPTRKSRRRPPTDPCWATSPSS